MGVSDKPVASVLPRPQGRLVRAMQPRRDAPELQSIFDSPQLIRGEIDKPGDVVPRGLPEFLAGSKQAKIDADESGRLQLANWIASERNPLTARVIVNRFGAGCSVKASSSLLTTLERPEIYQAIKPYSIILPSALWIRSGR